MKLLFKQMSDDAFFGLLDATLDGDITAKILFTLYREKCREKLYEDELSKILDF